MLVSGLYAVSGISRVHARFELGFLRVKAVFDVGGAFAFEMEAGDRRVAVRGCMQNDFVRGVVQLNVGVIHGLATGTQGAAVTGYGLWQAEEVKRLVKQVRTEVVPYPCARAGVFAPAVAHLRAVAIPAGDEEARGAKNAASEELFQGEVVTVPAAVVEDTEQAPVFGGKPDKRLPFGKGVNHRLFEDDVTTCGKALCGKLVVDAVRRGDDDQFGIAFRQHGGSIGVTRDSEIRLRATADQRSQTVGRVGGDERQMEGAGGHAAADEVVG